MIIKLLHSRLLDHEIKVACYHHIRKTFNPRKHIPDHEVFHVLIPAGTATTSQRSHVVMLRLSKEVKTVEKIKD